MQRAHLQRDAQQQPRARAASHLRPRREVDGPVRERRAQTRSAIAKEEVFERGADARRERRRERVLPRASFQSSSLIIRREGSERMQEHVVHVRPPEPVQGRVVFPRARDEDALVVVHLR